MVQERFQSKEKEKTMNILSIDTSTNILSIALKTASSYEERLVDGNFSHSENLLFEIESILKRAKMAIKDLDLLICTRGPGSFTGLRIGMATLKGFSSALSIPMVSVPTLKAIERSVGFYPGLTLSTIDAKKKRFYIRLSKNNETILDDRDAKVEDIVSYFDEDEVLITGPDAASFAKKLKEINEDARIIIDTFAPRNISRALIELGLEQYESIGADDIGQGPVYIRRSDAEEALLKRIEEENRW